MYDFHKAYNIKADSCSLYEISIKKEKESSTFFCVGDSIEDVCDVCDGDLLHIKKIESDIYLTKNAFSKILEGNNRIIQDVQKDLSEIKS